MPVAAAVLVFAASSSACSADERLTTRASRLDDERRMGQPRRRPLADERSGCRCRLSVEEMVVDAGDAERSASRRWKGSALRFETTAGSSRSRKGSPVRVLLWNSHGDRNVGRAPHQSGFPPLEQTSGGRGNQSATDPGARWARMLGFHFQGLILRRGS